MNPSARLYNCARCHCQVLICRFCDRGNIYCAQACARPARLDTLHRARKKYQSSRAGRLANALRQHRYRIRQRIKVTQQGSTWHRCDDVLPLKQKSVNKFKRQRAVIDKPVLRCHFCQRECDVFLRLDFLVAPIRPRLHR